MQGASTVDDKRMRCPRCRARSTVQNAVELRPGVQYLTQRGLKLLAVSSDFDSAIPRFARDEDRFRKSRSRDGFGSLIQTRPFARNAACWRTWIFVETAHLENCSRLVLIQESRNEIATKWGKRP
jgi:hypothetical protein